MHRVGAWACRAGPGGGGWIAALEARNGALWGKVEWTERGREAGTTSREYRYLSPVFLHSKDSPQRILQLLSAGLTNSPNLRMTALNRNACLMGRQAARGDDMTSIREITQVLAVEAIEALKAERDSAQSPSLEKFVPPGPD